jgi:hypothetical protein
MSRRQHRSQDQTADSTPPQLALTHGQTIWLLSELGFHRGVTASTFNYYIKSLRKLDIPFDKGKGQSEGHRHITYDFEELMELSLALLLRVYGTLPDSVVMGLRRFRNQLRPIYRQAYSECKDPHLQSARIVGTDSRSVTINGLYLDLNIRYSAGRMVEFGPPRVLSAFDAAALYITAEVPARAYLPLNLSGIADMIVSRTHTLPAKRRARAVAPST